MISLSRASDSLFALAWLVILYVSVVDGYLLLHCRDVILQTERNPVGVTLLDIAGGRIWLFLTLKVIGTIVVSAILLVLYRSNRRFGLTVAFAIAGFQLVLLAYLSYGR